jgi:hypothetical protein
MAPLSCACSRRGVEGRSDEGVCDECASSSLTKSSVLSDAHADEQTPRATLADGGVGGLSESGVDEVTDLTLGCAGLAAENT